MMSNMEGYTFNFGINCNNNGWYLVPILSVMLMEKLRIKDNHSLCPDNKLSSKLLKVN
ncbi:hypothetical protein HanIR_Chr15g0779611 [Helianthus annuus]|nr:hypothetical protein HanIR_Chr15g0779611 [Helianthus annuus]